jgi:hypothetical protein
MQNDESNFLCEICNKRFKSKNTLNVHYKTKCSLLLNKNNNVKDTQIIPANSKQFNCEYCSKTISSKQMLKYHHQICFAQKTKIAENEWVQKIENIENNIKTDTQRLLLSSHSDIQTKLTFYQNSLRNELLNEICNMKAIMNIASVHEELDEYKKIKEELKMFKTTENVSKILGKMENEIKDEVIDMYKELFNTNEIDNLMKSSKCLSQIKSEIKDEVINMHRNEIDNLMKSSKCLSQIKSEIKDEVKNELRDEIKQELLLELRLIKNN